MGCSVHLSSQKSHIITVKFDPVNNRRLANLCGPLNQHLQQLEKYFGVTIYQNSNQFRIKGLEQAPTATKQILLKLYDETQTDQPLTSKKIFMVIQQHTEKLDNDEETSDSVILQTRHKTIKPRNQHQLQYIQNIQHHDINFAIGPAGTGKTYLAVACAVHAFEQGHVQRLIFVRPAVEAGEKLGFLPGDMVEKVTPYMRPMYDALYEMLGFDHAQKLIEHDVIEIAPLAFMRGRTLSDAFIILDEAQNTTIQQMQMFLTRLGFGSTVVVNGDDSQIDLPRGVTSGLDHARRVLSNTDKISFNQFDAKDAVRHPLVSEIIHAYQQFNGQDD